MDAEVVGLVAVGGTPHLLEQLAMGHESPAILREHAQDVELNRCQVDLLVAATHAPVGHVDHKVADLDLGPAGGAAQSTRKPALRRTTRSPRTI